ncbi:MAG: septum formation initiator family protein [Candidatus Berkelbacteria bacterium]|nr:septum formation initiator family protein [Candidatus Berkelbacteria bacterium]
MDNSQINSESNNDTAGKPGFNYLSIIILLVIAYAIFLLYQAISINYQTNQKIHSLKNDLKQVNQDKARLETLIAYYQTGAFQELEARKKLGFKMPGEKVVSVKVEPSAETIPDVFAPVNQNPSIQIHKSNPQKWYDFVRGIEQEE